MTLTPIAAREREPILDALRGFAVLGILLVNIEVMRGPGWLLLLDGASAAPSGRGDGVIRFLIGWLGTGKFLSSLAILFGVGAALIAARSLTAGRSPRRLLARRYACLMLFGLAHMALYPGDILFLYGLSGFALLPFATLRARAALFWAAVIFAAYTCFVMGILSIAPSYAAELPAGAFDTLPRALAASALEAYRSGSWPAIFEQHVEQALFLQALQLAVLPWVLALFLLGFAVGRAGILVDIDRHRTLLKRVAWIGLALGLPLNFGLGFGGPLSGWGAPAPGEASWVAALAETGKNLGEPVLAAGYLCSLSLLWLRREPPRPLVAVGRMALTAYVLESALALAAFGGLGLYDRLTTSSALLVVGAIWAVELVFCPLWLRRFRFGPAEWLWRSITYRTMQPMRRRHAER